MGSERASVFEEEDLDISGFAPKAAEPPAPPLEKIRAVSEGASFRSREPPAVAPAARNERERRRFRTGRNVQLNIKARSEAIDAFYAIADREGWVLGEAFEHAVEALERALAGKSETFGEGEARPRRRLA